MCVEMIDLTDDCLRILAEVFYDRHGQTSIAQGNKENATRAVLSHEATVCIVCAEMPMATSGQLRGLTQLSTNFPA